MFNCLLCSGKSFSTKYLLAQHCKGKSHLHNAEVGVTINESEEAAAKEAVHAFNCSVCPDASFDSELALNRHCKGKRHLELSTEKHNESASSESLSFSCLICLGASFKTKDNLRQHCEGKKHLEIAAGKRNESDTGTLSQFFYRRGGPGRKDQTGRGQAMGSTACSSGSQMTDGGA